MSILWKPLIVKFLKAYFPLDKKETPNNIAHNDNGGGISNNSNHEKEN